MDPRGRGYCRGPPLPVGQACPAERQEPDLGFGGIDCLQCVVHQRDGNGGWVEFGAEPLIRQVRDGGPADGRLQDGDVVVAVDDLPITTEAGGRRFARPDLGKPLRLTVRRGGRELTVEVVPGVHCAAEEVKLPPRRAASAHARNRGWLGFGVECSWCSAQTQPDGAIVWDFRGYPTIVAIDSAGPAATADLRLGDEVRAIDGRGLLTPQGGRRFGAIKPGDRVRLTVQRGAVQYTVVLTAVRRPEP